MHARMTGEKRGRDRRDLYMDKKSDERERGKY